MRTWPFRAGREMSAGNGETSRWASAPPRQNTRNTTIQGRDHRARAPAVAHFVSRRDEGSAMSAAAERVVTLDVGELQSMLDAAAERGAERALAALHGDDRSSAAGWVDAATKARLLGVSRRFVYAHAEELGGERLHDGEKSPWRFPSEPVSAATPCCSSRESQGRIASSGAGSRGSARGRDGGLPFPLDSGYIVSHGGAAARGHGAVRAVGVGGGPGRRRRANRGDSRSDRGHGERGHEAQAEPSAHPRRALSLGGSFPASRLLRRRAAPPAGASRRPP
jgi:hypothetical protein